MQSQLYCPDDTRRSLVRASGTVNGINYLEVLDTVLGETSAAKLLRQRVLLVHCFLSMAGWSREHVVIEGGVRITSVKVLWALPANAFLPPATGTPPLPDTSVVPPAEKALLNPVLSALPNPARVLVVRTDQTGDASTYILRLIPPNLTSSPPFDPRLDRVSFSFKAECPSEFDCQQSLDCPDSVADLPQIDYLAKDYASFRRLMLDRLSTLMPNWTERNPADLGIALVEVLAYAGDYLSYQQDATATEAYLGTARRRTSVRRHARLVDYLVHDGANARTWICLTINKKADGTEDELTGDADNPLLPASTPLVSQVPAEAIALTRDQFQIFLASSSPTVFETLYPVTLLKSSRNEIPFYTWDDPNCCLPRGATRATLQGSAAELELHKGDVLILEEVRGAESGHEEDADFNHRHAVRLDAEPTELIDPINDQTVLEVSWYAEDALPFPLCLNQVPDKTGKLKSVSVARGNVVLADHGTTIKSEALNPPQVPSSGQYRPYLDRLGLTQALPYDLKQINRPAMELRQVDLRRVLPSITLYAAGEPWHPQRTLLNSDRFAQEFVLEMEDDGRAYLRFGDDILGQKPPSGTEFKATYRLGNGEAGNIGAEALVQIVAERNDVRAAIAEVRNPLPAWGGIDPELIEQVKLYAPEAFRTQERAVTVADYATIAQRHPQVQRAAATRRWTGSWYTIFVTVDRIGGLPVNKTFKGALKEFLDPYRKAAYDIEIEAPIFVPLNILLKVCIKPNYIKGNVKRSLLEIFSNTTLPNGQRGFFHPDNFTFGQSVYLSQIIATAMQVPGVDWVQAEKFERWDRPSVDEKELTDGLITLERLEIARLDNDPSLAENGKIDFDMGGGL